jgi:hypothetical protein
VVNEDQIKSSVVFYECLLALQNAPVDHYPMVQSCMLVDLMGDISHIVVGLYSVNDGIGMGGHEE